MRAFAEIEAGARDRVAFSNGSEFMDWEWNWCERGCVHDAAFRRGEALEGCPLLVVAFLGQTPSEWLEQEHPRGPGDLYTCIEYRDEDEGPGPEPQPIPDPPDQEVLFPREQAEGVRMLTSEPTRQEVSV